MNILENNLKIKCDELEDMKNCHNLDINNLY